MIQLQTIKIPYKPRVQLVPYHTRQERFACIVAHRRFGKTVGVVNDMIRRATENIRPFPQPRYAYIAPYQKQAKEITWQYFKHYAGKIPGTKFNESKGTITLPNGAVIIVLGADNPDALRGNYLDGAVLDEFGDMRPSVLPEVVMPMLADYRGWLTIIGTPKGHNQFFDVHNIAKQSPKWFFLLLKASKTGIVGEEELEQQRNTMTKSQYDQEFECSFNAAIIGSYYGELITQAELEGRICTFNYDESLPVHTAWDLGVSDTTSIWFAQFVKTELRIIDYLEANGKGANYYVKELQNKPYIYGRHIVPHDARAREWGNEAKSRIQTLVSLGIRPEVAPQLSVEDGINAVRLALPHCKFNLAKTKEGLEGLRHYRAEPDDKRSRSNERPYLKIKPEHNWASHPSDAFRYLCVTWEKEYDRLIKSPKGIESATLDDLWELEEKFTNLEKRV